MATTAASNNIVKIVDDKLLSLISKISEKFSHDENCVNLKQSLNHLKQFLDEEGLSSLAFKAQNNPTFKQCLEELSKLIDSMFVFVTDIGKKKLMSQFFNATKNANKTKEFNSLINDFKEKIKIDTTTSRESGTISVEATDTITEKTLAAKLDQFKSCIRNNLITIPDKDSTKNSYTYPNGDYYDGLWNKGRRHGKGNYICNNGIIFEGEWYKNEMYGKGKLFHDGTLIYEGSFKYGLKSGKGTLHWGETTYVGDFTDDKANGYGKLSLGASSFGASYEGRFKNNMKDGKGKSVNSAGDQYEGEWKAKNMHGFGVLTTAEGKYEGYFKNNMKHGKGKMQFKTE